MLKINGKSVIPEVTALVVLAAATVPFMTSVDVLGVVGSVVALGVMSVVGYLIVSRRMGTR